MFRSQEPKTYVYLLGGLGNNLFQINYGLSLSDRNVLFVSNLIKSKFWSWLFNWSHHEDSVLQITFLNEVNIQQISPVKVLFHLIGLKVSKFVGSPILGVSWESIHGDRVNFGYFQNTPHQEWIVKLRTSVSLENYEHVLHMRLGDSPTLQVDVDAQIKLLRVLGLKMIYVVTNDCNSATSILNELDIDFELLRGGVMDNLDALMRAKILIVPQSTFSLTAVFLSNSLETLYVNDRFWSLKGKDIRCNVVYY